MQSLSATIIDNIGEKIAKSDDIIGDLAAMKLSNDVAYSLLNKAKLWIVKTMNSNCCSKEGKYNAWLFKAPTRDAAMKQYLLADDDALGYVRTNCKKYPQLDEMFSDEDVDYADIIDAHFNDIMAILNSIRCVHLYFFYGCDEVELVRQLLFTIKRIHNK